MFLKTPLSLSLSLNNEISFLVRSSSSIFDHYDRNHRCLMSEVPCHRTITGSLTCHPGHPATMPLDKVKLHYVIHYLHRGLFNYLVPEVPEEERDRIDYYTCNICKRKFRNAPAKQEYPGT